MNQDIDMAVAVPELAEKIDAGYVAYKGTIVRRSGTQAAKTQLMNIMFNSIDVIIAALDSVRQLKRENESLTKALAEADEEYVELNKKYKALVSGSAEKTKKKSTVGSASDTK